MRGVGQRGALCAGGGAARAGTGTRVTRVRRRDGPASFSAGAEKRRGNTRASCRQCSDAVFLRVQDTFKAAAKKKEEGEKTESGSAQEEQPKQSPLVGASLALLKFYKREISPLLPPSCRYVPTCSEYAMEAYSKFGFGKGTVLTAWRIFRCSPWGGRGYDPPCWPPVWR
mmetsp:Transcript_21573/g.45365  ORF Transcript_21573/g.45365 Transcript_21573/m.45365 type:complete len:170 (+) Transcript_21573:187-696(+)